jgi:hypothetical protein
VTKILSNYQLFVKREDPFLVPHFYDAHVEVSWVVIPCSVVVCYHWFKGLCCLFPEDGGSIDPEDHGLTLHCCENLISHFSDAI